MHPGSATREDRIPVVWRGRARPGLAALLGLLLAAASACGSRSGLLPISNDSTTDGGTAACRNLVAVGTTKLGSPQSRDVIPSIVFDGTRFAVAWLRRSQSSSSTDADLRFSRVSPEGVAESTQGIRVDAAAAGLEPRVVHAAGEYGLLYLGPESTGTGNQTLLARLDAQAKARGAPVKVAGWALGAALAATSPGYAVLYLPPAHLSTLELARVSASGTVTQSTVSTGGVYNDPWLLPRSDGFAAGWWGSWHYFARLSADGRLAADPVKVAQRVYTAPSRYVSRPGGYAMARLTPRMNGTYYAELSLLDPDGTEPGTPHLIAEGISSEEDQLALVWTGTRYVVVYDAGRADLKLSAQLLDAAGSQVGSPTQIPACMLTASNPEVAWGAGTLVVAYEGGLSGLPESEVCVSRLRCEQ